MERSTLLEPAAGWGAGFGSAGVRCEDAVVGVAVAVCPPIFGAAAPELDPRHDPDLHWLLADMTGHQPLNTPGITWPHARSRSCLAADSLEI